MPIVVLDTNILISAFLTPHGEADEIVRRAKGEVLCLSPFIFSEVMSIEARAAYLVTRNIKHFPRNHADVTIITPKEFFRITKPIPEES